MAIARVIQEEVFGCKSVAFDEHAIARMSSETSRRMRSSPSWGIQTRQDCQPNPIAFGIAKR